MFDEFLTTKRLVLRPPVEEDASRLVELLDNWNVVKTLAQVPYPYKPEHAEEFLVLCKRRKNADDRIDYCMTMDGELLGFVGIAPRSSGPNLGYWLGEPFWRRGIATEAVGAVAAAFFRWSERPALMSGIFLGNDASLAVQRKFGFEVVGESIVMCVARGIEVRHVDTVLTRKRHEELQS
ncbi:MAG: GNAT family N-acetyltransferase [Hyphomicrobiaceae bacterium]